MTKQHHNTNKKHLHQMGKKRGRTSPNVDTPTHKKNKNSTPSPNSFAVLEDLDNEKNISPPRHPPVTIQPHSTTPSCHTSTPTDNKGTPTPNSRSYKKRNKGSAKSSVLSFNAACSFLDEYPDNFIIEPRVSMEERPPNIGAQLKTLTEKVVHLSDTINKYDDVFASIHSHLSDISTQIHINKTTLDNHAYPPEKCITVHPFPLPEYSENIGWGMDQIFELGLNLKIHCVRAKHIISRSTGRTTETLLVELPTVWDCMLVMKNKHHLRKSEDPLFRKVFIDKVKSNTDFQIERSTNAILEAMSTRHTSSFHRTYNTGHQDRTTPVAPNPFYRQQPLYNQHPSNGRLLIGQPIPRFDQTHIHNNRRAHHRPHTYTTSMSRGAPMASSTTGTSRGAPSVSTTTATSRGAPSDSSTTGTSRGSTNTYIQHSPVQRSPIQQPLIQQSTTQQPLVQQSPIQQPLVQHSPVMQLSVQQPLHMPPPVHLPPPVHMPPVIQSPFHQPPIMQPTVQQHAPTQQQSAISLYQHYPPPDSIQQTVTTHKTCDYPATQVSTSGIQLPPGISQTAPLQQQPQYHILSPVNNQQHNNVLYNNENYASAFPPLQ